MSITDWMVAGYCFLFCLFWSVSYLLAWRGALRFSLFENECPPEPETWPMLSVVIPACDEADTIEAAMATLLRQDYPDMEVILVNDRSTDRTGEIISAVAARDKRVRAVHLDALPPGWLGKVHALHVGTQKASGEWLLYSDADIHFRQGTLRKAVALAIRKQADHLTLGPALETPSFWLKVAVQTFGMMFATATKAADVEHGSDAFVGIGAFNMVRRSALERTEGFPWLRMEVADDVGLGLMLHRSGAKTCLSVCLEDVRLLWYPSVHSMVKGLEKNIFGVAAHYSFIRMMLLSIFLWMAVLAPPTAIFQSEIPYLRIWGGIIYLFVIIAALIGKFRLGWEIMPSLFAHLGILMISFMLIRSGMICGLRGGIRWRKTFYPVDELRAGQRVKL